MTATPSILLEIEGEPVPQPRPRVTPQRTYTKGMERGGRLWRWKRQIMWQAATAGGVRGWEGGIRVDLAFVLPRPRAHHVNRDPNRPLRDAAPRLHLQKPDVDNLEKAVIDALTKSGIWRDDAQVIETSVTKLWAVPPRSWTGVKVKIHFF